MELARFPSRGGFSLRSILTFVLAVLLTVIIGVLFTSHPVHAADASWDGASLRYDGNQYLSMGETQPGNTLGLPEKTPYYVYVAPKAPNNATTSKVQKAYVIYFAPGVSPPSATTATHAEYDYTISSKTYANQSNAQTITIDAAASSSGTSCAIEGIGWLACPAMTWLAGGMDGIFGLIAGFMEVQPLQTGNTDSSLYIAWNTVRGIANIAFMIVFLIIIYAQLTNVQLAKYGLKKLLPRLIIAAIAINISYIIAAAAVDISNILGYSIEDMFMNIQRAMIDSGTVDANAQADINSAPSWAAFTAFIISGGTAAVVGVSSAIAATGGMLAAAAYILLPVLLGLLLALIVVFLILAARQAIIIILIILAPLAIVAYLLPNTEKWFEKWRDLLMTMLIFFPAFAVVFGGAQLAATVIIKNADSVTMQLLGMVVMVAPLVITPLLMKLSGSVLGNIARIVNDPRKGLIDRTRNWSKDRAEWHRQRGVGMLDRHGNPMQRRSVNPFRQAASSMDQRKKRLADRTTNAATAAQTRYENDKYHTARPNRRGHVKYDMAQQKAYFEDGKAATHSNHEAHVNEARRTQGSMIYQSGITAQAAKDRATASQNYTDAFYNNARRDQKIAGGVLHASGYKVELSKDKLTATENLKVAYYNEQRSTAGTDLYAMAKTLETSKLRVEDAQNTYTSVVEEWKVAPGTGISLAAQRAQSSKEHLEAAQARLQAFFDTERRTDGSMLNISSLSLEEAKLGAETSKSFTAAYIDTQKQSVGSSLHLATVRASDAKGKAQLAETRTSKMIEEYKSGMLVRTGELSQLITSMSEDVENIAAETQGAQAAQNVQKKNIAEAFTAGTPRAQELLRAAQSVDQYGDVRAEAGALATLDDINNKARTANEALIEERAVADNMTPKNYAMSLIEARLGGDQSASEDIIRAAMEIVGKEAQIPIIRKMRRSHNFNQDHLTAMILRNSGIMKAKGGFDLQNDTRLIHASEEVMNASIAGTIGSTAPSQFADLKNGAIIDYASRLNLILQNTHEMSNSTNPDPVQRSLEQSFGANGTMGIQKAYRNLTQALNDPEIVRTLGDNLIPAIRMHQKIHQSNQFHNAAMDVNYAVIDPQGLVNQFKDDPTEVAPNSY